MKSERFDLGDLAPQPWKNGAGLTREIAVSPAGAGLEAFDWRLSVAEVERDGPFSAFPGIDRQLVLLGGAGMQLASTHGEIAHRLDRPHEPFAFSGDLAIDATLLAGPTTDFNVMTRRGVCRAEVTAHRTAFALPAGGTTLLLCGQGEWQVEGEDSARLAPWQGMLWRESRPALAAEPRREDPGACLLLVRLAAAAPST